MVQPEDNNPPPGIALVIPTSLLGFIVIVVGF